MKKTTTNSDELTIKIMSFGDEIEVNVSDGATVEDVLQEAGISLASGQSVYSGGEEAELEFEVEDEDVLQIIGKKDGGSDDEEAPAPEEENPQTEEDKEEAPAPKVEA